jgi:hypothetical protein
MYKFDIDEVWETRDGQLVRIVELSSIESSYPYPISGVILKTNVEMQFTSNGTELSQLETNYDLMRMRGHVKDFPEYFL